MRRKAHFFLKEVNNYDTIDNFNLKSPPICKYMQPFENDRTDMVKNITFTKHQDNIQKKIINDSKRIHSSKNIYIRGQKNQFLFYMFHTHKKS